MIELSAIIYGPGDTKRFVSGSTADVRANVILYLQDEGAEARNLSNTALSNLATVQDSRLPSTVTDFDATYPDATFSTEFLTPDPPST